MRKVTKRQAERLALYLDQPLELRQEVRTLLVWLLGVDEATPWEQTIRIAGDRAQWPEATTADLVCSESDAIVELALRLLELRTFT